MEGLVLFMLLLALALGYLIGVITQGIKVTINHPEKIVEKEVEKPEYNEVYLDNMDPQTRAYLEKNHGQLKL